MAAETTRGDVETQVTTRFLFVLSFAIKIKCICPIVYRADISNDFVWKISGTVGALFAHLLLSFYSMQRAGRPVRTEENFAKRAPCARPLAKVDGKRRSEERANEGSSRNRKSRLCYAHKTKKQAHSSLLVPQDSTTYLVLSSTSSESCARPALLLYFVSSAVSRQLFNLFNFNYKSAAWIIVESKTWNFRSARSAIVRG